MLGPASPKQLRKEIRKIQTRMEHSGLEWEQHFERHCSNVPGTAGTAAEAAAATACIFTITPTVTKIEVLKNGGCLVAAAAPAAIQTAPGTILQFLSNMLLPLHNPFVLQPCVAFPELFLILGPKNFPKISESVLMHQRDPNIFRCNASKQVRASPQTPKTLQKLRKGCKKRSKMLAKAGTKIMKRDMFYEEAIIFS